MQEKQQNQQIEESSILKLMGNAEASSVANLKVVSYSDGLYNKADITDAVETTADIVQN